MDSQNSDRDGKLSVATTDSLYGSSLPLPALLPHSHSQQISPLGYDRRGETERGLEVFPRSSSYGYSSLQVWFVILHNFSLPTLVLGIP